jgi:hypothetical protein
MKTIILPTDFSEEAANAFRYAGALASRNKSRLVLVHAIPVEFLTTQEGSEVALPPAPQQQAYYLDKLVESGKQIRLESGHAFEMEAVCIQHSKKEPPGKVIPSKYFQRARFSLRRPPVGPAAESPAIGSRREAGGALSSETRNTLIMKQSGVTGIGQSRIKSALST